MNPFQLILAPLSDTLTESGSAQIRFTSILGFALELDSKTADRLKGIGTVGLFFIVMPLFLLIESPGKEVKDYMLTEENIKKMRDGERKRKS